MMENRQKIITSIIYLFIFNKGNLNSSSIDSHV